MLREQELTTLQVAKAITKESWPFFLNRGLELIVIDYWVMSMFSQQDEENGSAASLMGAMMIVLRSIPATALFYTPQKTLEYKEPTEKAHVLRKAYLLSIMLSLISNFAAATSRYTLPLFKLPARSIQMTQNFLNWYTPGLLFTFPNIANQQWLTANGQPKKVLGMTALTGPLPILLTTYFLLPTYKEAALGMSYSLSALLQSLSYYFYFKKGMFKNYLIFNFNLRDFIKTDPVFWELFHKGKWIAVYAGIELGTVTVSTFLIGSYGQDALQALQPAQIYFSILANLIFSWTIGIAILVKRNKNLPRLAKKFGNVGALMCFIMASLVLSCFGILRDSMLKPFLKNNVSEDTQTLAFYLLLTNLIGQLADSLRNAFTANLRGIGNTSFASKVNALLVLLINLPASLVTRFAIDLGPLWILPPRILTIFIGASLIGNEWREQIGNLFSSSLQEPLLENKPEPEESKPGCWGRLKNLIWKSPQSSISPSQELATLNSP